MSLILSPYRFASGPIVSDTKALLHFDGSGTAITDETGKTCTAYGSATQSATQSKFGGKSLYIPTGGRVEIASSTDFDFGTGAFLLEWWEYNLSNSSYQNSFSRGYNLAGGIFYQSGSGSGVRGLYFIDGGGTAKLITATTVAAPLNTWRAMAVQRDATGVVRLFVGGVNVQSAGPNANSQLSLGLSAPFVCGADNASLYSIDGYQDEWRIQKGVAPYTSAGYTPAAAPFTYP